MVYAFKKAWIGSMRYILNKFSVISAVWLCFLSLNSYAESSTKDENNSPNQRIVALAPHIVEMLFSIGVGDNIVGTTEHSDYPEQANNIPRIGNYARLKIEDILAYQPDLIIAWKTGNPSDDLERLEKLGLNIVYSDPIRLEDVATELRYFGKLTGVTERAEELAKEYEAELKEIKTQYQNKASISVFYELWPNPLTTVGKNALPQQHLSICGANNPFEESATDYPQIGLEQVIVTKPQVIIQPISKGESTPNAIKWSQWQEVPATKHNQFIKPNSDKLHRTTARLLGELKKLCADIDESRKFYAELNRK